MENMKKARILVINTGNSSTKVAVFDGYDSLFLETLKHSDEELSAFPSMNDQKDYRAKTIKNWLSEKGVPLDTLSAVASRGGLLKPLISGTYLVDESMIRDLKEGKRGTHASNLSAQIGKEIADSLDISCYIVDPVSVDEYSTLARYSGHALFERVSLSHALNMKRIAKQFARESELKYEDLNLLVIHMGSGISISLHSGGKMIDGLNSSEEGPFSPDRSGSMPVRQLLKYVLDNNLDYKTADRLIFGDGGIFSYLGTRDFTQVAERYRKGEEKVIELVEALAYQVAKETGALATVVKGKIDAILITGGMAYADFLVDLITSRIKFIAPVWNFPGEEEMHALAEGVIRVFQGDEQALSY